MNARTSRRDLVEIINLNSHLPNSTFILARSGKAAMTAQTWNDGRIYKER